MHYVSGKEKMTTNITLNTASRTLVGESVIEVVIEQRIVRLDSENSEKQSAVSTPIDNTSFSSFHTNSICQVHS